MALGATGMLRHMLEDNRVLQYFQCRQCGEWCREFRGPVTNLTSLEGYIILTIGNRLETHQWTGSNLLRTAFFDAPILISSLNVVKTYIIFGDVHKGIYFVNYRDQVMEAWLYCRGFSLNPKP
jgi:cleavage and polyadenylation specificity factor subunit 1